MVAPVRHGLSCWTTHDFSVPDLALNSLHWFAHCLHRSLSHMFAQDQGVSLASLVHSLLRDVGLKGGR